MEKIHDLDFDSWFDIFQDKCKALDYHGPIDKYSFEWDWENEKTPEESAEEFVKEMNEEQQLTNDDQEKI